MMQQINTKEELVKMYIYDAATGDTVPFPEAKQPFPSSLEDITEEYTTVNGTFKVRTNLLPPHWFGDSETIHESLL